MNLAYVVIIFGVLSIAGGVLDFFRTKRFRSLAIAGATGFFIAGCGVALTSGFIGWTLPKILALVGTVIMLIYFFSRFMKKESPATDILMMVASLAVIIAMIMI